MLRSNPPVPLQTVPATLVTAAINHVDAIRPRPDAVDRAVLDVAIRRGYSDETAIALALRVRASAILFADPDWRVVKRLRLTLDPYEYELAVRVIYAFIGAAPVDRPLRFSHRELLAMLLEALPAHGNC